MSDARIQKFEEYGSFEDRVVELDTKLIIVFNEVQENFKDDFWFQKYKEQLYFEKIKAGL